MAETDSPRWSSPPDGRDVPATPDRHERYHHRINAVAGVFAGVGLILGVGLLILLLSRPTSNLSVRTFITPVAFGFGGYMFGMAVMCLFAPREFLTGPVGRPWMKMIGTRSVTVARIACAVFGVIGTAIGVGLGFLFVMMAFGN